MCACVIVSAVWIFVTLLSSAQIMDTNSSTLRIGVVGYGHLGMNPMVTLFGGLTIVCLTACGWMCMWFRAVPGGQTP